MQMKRRELRDTYRPTKKEVRADTGKLGGASQRPLDRDGPFGRGQTGIWSQGHAGLWEVREKRPGPNQGVRAFSPGTRTGPYQGLAAEECGILDGCAHGRCVRVPEGFTCDCFDGYRLDMTRMACVGERTAGPVGVGGWGEGGGPD